MNLTLLVQISVIGTGGGVPGVEVRIARVAAGAPSRPMGSGVTDASGTARISIDVARAGLAELPVVFPLEVAVTLHDERGRVMHRAQRTVEAYRSQVRLSVALTKAELAQWLRTRPPRRTPDEKWVDVCRDVREQARTPEGARALCLAQGLLATMTHLDAPTNNLEMRAAEVLNKRFSGAEIEQVKGLSARALARLRKCLPDTDPTCAEGIDVDGLANALFFGGGAPFPGFEKIVKSIAPDPTLTLGPQQPGWAWGTPFHPSKDCAVTYLTLHPEGHQRLHVPLVNAVEVWDPDHQATIREAEVGPRQLTVRVVDPAQGWRAEVLDMDVPLNDETCLVLVGDDHAANAPSPGHYPGTSGNQVLAIDVRPGQKVKLMGGGFVASECRIVAEFRGWQDEPEDGRLVPKASVGAAGALNGTTLTAHGTPDPPPPGVTITTSIRDEMVLEWPAGAGQAGIYSLRFEFENTTELPTSITHTADCDVELDFGPVRSNVLHFVVLPALASPRFTVTATQMVCQQKTNQGLLHLADDIFYQADGLLTAVVTKGDGTLEEDLRQVISRSGSRLFWGPGTWNALLRNFPENLPPAVVGLDEFVTAHVKSSEVAGPTDRLILGTVLTVLLILLVLLVVAIVIAVVAIFVVTYGVAASVIVAIIGGVVSFMGFMFGPVFAAGMAAITALVATVTGAEVMGHTATAFSGKHLAHRLSPFRFHRVLWPYERPPLGPAAGTMTEVSSDESADGIVTEYSSIRLGSSYRYFIEAQSLGQ